MRTVIALGGNALLRRGEPAEADVQRRNVSRPLWLPSPTSPPSTGAQQHAGGPDAGDRPEAVLREARVAP